MYYRSWSLSSIRVICLTTDIAVHAVTLKGDVKYNIYTNRYDTIQLFLRALKSRQVASLDYRTAP